MRAFRRTKTALLLAAIILLCLYAQGTQGAADNCAVPDVCFSLEAGAYPEECITLELSAPEPYAVYYTTDGSVPTGASVRYEEPILLDAGGSRWLDEEAVSLLRCPGDKAISVSQDLPAAWVVRAVAVSPDGDVGNTVTKTYFPGLSLAERYQGAMVISLVTAPENLLDYEKGILVPGLVYDAWVRSAEAAEILEEGIWDRVQGNYSQHGRAWERPASIELFDGNDSLTLQGDVGIRIRGNLSRIYNQKSFSVLYRESYGQAYMDYALFPESGVRRYDSFILRNGGNEMEFLKFKDGWLQSMLADRAFTVQHDRPAILFLNGEYWGVYNLMEKIDALYIEQLYGVRDILLIKEGELIGGREEDAHLYEELMAYAGADMSDRSVWNEFRTLMDVQSMADYFAAEIYIGNWDWTSEKNICLWRTVDEEPGNPYGDGRWRYVLFDTEFSASLYGIMETDYLFNSMEKAVRDHPLFAAALRNPEFRDTFAKSIRDIGRNCFSAEDVNRTLTEWETVWKPFMGDTYKRFSDTSWAWDYSLASVKSFFSFRYDPLVSAVSAVLVEQSR